MSYWAYTSLRDAFSGEIRERFGPFDVPPVAKWIDSELAIKAYVVWPESDLGKPMYLTVKRHWWSWNGKLAYLTR